MKSLWQGSRGRTHKQWHSMTSNNIRSPANRRVLWRYLSSETEAAPGLPHLLQHVVLDACRADVLVHHTMFQLDIIHQQTHQRRVWQGHQRQTYRSTEEERDQHKPRIVNISIEVQTLVLTKKKPKTSILELLGKKNNEKRSITTTRFMHHTPACPIKISLPQPLIQSCLLSTYHFILKRKRNCLV